MKNLRLKGRIRNWGILVSIALALQIPGLRIHAQSESVSMNVRSIESTGESISVEFILNQANVSFESLKTGGVTREPGMPILPAVSHFLVVSPDAGLELEIEVIQKHREPAMIPPELFEEEATGLTAGHPGNLTEVFPSQVAEMNQPTIIRGVRLVKVTTYPVQYDPQRDEYIYNDQITITLHHSGNTPVNPVIRPFNERRDCSREFLKYINALVLNPELLHRDNALDISQFAGHYLVVAHENCVLPASEFIEWRRKAGFKVDILPVSQENSQDSQFIKAAIQEKYDEYLEQNIDPFDNILLIGDRHIYGHGGPAPQWELEADAGNSTWRDPHHADYTYALLEGNDHHMDVAISRWAAGNLETLALDVGRTLSYETDPYMDDTSWFTRGAVGSQHWGNNPEAAWDVTIHTNVRWGTEVLEHLGYDDIRFNEEYEYDQHGQSYGPWIRDILNEGLNIIISRAENLYWLANLQGVEDNVVFPIRLNTSGHGEYATWNMLRRGDGEHLKGVVASTCGWGIPPTLPMSMSWLGLVKGVLIHDMTLGWGRVFAVTNFEKFYPDIELINQPVYRMVKSDIDCYGDPAIQPWQGVPYPRIGVEHLESTTPGSGLIEVKVIDTDMEDEPVPDLRVSLYMPGEIPDDPWDYADQELFQVTTHSGPDGYARFLFDEEFEFETGTMFVTVTGRDIIPAFSSLTIEPEMELVELSRYEISEVEGEGNGDDLVNPGEVFLLNFFATNRSQENPVEDVTAEVISLSPWLEVDENQIDFGNIEADSEAQGDEAVTLRIHASCPDREIPPGNTLPMLVQFEYLNGNWTSALELEPISPGFRIRSIDGGNLISIEEQDLVIEIENRGRIDASETNAVLESMGAGVLIISGEAVYPPLEAGGHTTIEGDPFRVAGSPVVVPGSQHEMRLILSTEDEFTDTVYFNLQVDESRENAPQGPDKYGYYCFDDTDQDWESAPVYDWIEISPHEDDRDYDGIACDFDGESEFNVGESQTVEMGMSTTFYGETFDRITICTNGFIAPGDQDTITNFQNWPLDQAMGGGMGMIAPFWDWLRFTEHSGVYYYHDEYEGRFTVEWFHMQHRSGGEEDLTFQVILLDRDIWGTPSGDQDILFQYKSISQVRGEQVGEEWETNIPFASIGISSPDGMHGINYSFNNQYPVTSATIENRCAILFSTSLIPIESHPPSRFALIYPDNNIAIDSSRVEFQWERSIDADPEDNLAYIAWIAAGEDTVNLGTDNTTLPVRLDTLALPFEQMFQDSTTWWVDAISGEDTVECDQRFKFIYSDLVWIEDGYTGNSLPSGYPVLRAYPNPANGPVELHFWMVNTGWGEISIYDLRGRIISTLVEDQLSVGMNRFTWDTALIPAGLYIMRYKTDEGSGSVKVAVVK